MRLNWQKMVWFALFGLLISVSILLSMQDEKVGSLIIWPELRVKSELLIDLNLSPDRKLLLRRFIELGAGPGSQVWKVQEDWRLGEKVYDSDEQREERGEYEITLDWIIGNKLLVYLAEGVGYWKGIATEPNFNDPEVSFKLIIVDPVTRQETLFPVTPAGFLASFMVHPDRDKVLVEPKDIQALVLYYIPNTRELRRVTVGYGSPIEWCPDKQRFWSMTTYSPDKGKNWKVEIFVVDIMKDQDKTLVATDWNGERYTFWMSGLLEAKEELPKDRVGNLRIEKDPEQYDLTTLVNGKELAILAYKHKAGKLVFLYLSPDKIARERELTEEMLPEALKQLGECWLIAMLPNGQEFLIRQGKHTGSDGQKWKKCDYWLWNMDTSEVKNVGKFGELIIYEWIEPRKAVVSVASMEVVEGKEKLFYDYGILTLP